MTVSMYQASVPGLLRMMNSLSTILGKAQEMAAARKLDEAKLLAVRLFPDMLPLSAQIQILSDTAKGIAARLSGTEIPSFPDTEATIDELKTRLAKTIEFVSSIHPSKFDGSATKKLEIPVGGGRKLDFTGQDYLFLNALPNFYFHATTAYDILRHCGLQVGKRDYLGAA